MSDMPIVHRGGAAIPGEDLLIAFENRGSLVAWAFVRLAQDPTRVYGGRVLDIIRPGQGYIMWRLVTRLAFHADDRRVSHIGAGCGLDEVLVLMLAPAGLEPTTLSMEYDAAVASLRRREVSVDA